MSVPNLLKIATAAALAIAVLGFSTGQQFTDVNVPIPTTVPDFDWWPDTKTDEDRDPGPLPCPIVALRTGWSEARTCEATWLARLGCRCRVLRSRLRNGG